MGYGPQHPHRWGRARVGQRRPSVSLRATYCPAPGVASSSAASIPFSCSASRYACTYASELPALVDRYAEAIRHGHDQEHGGGAERRRRGVDAIDQGEVALVGEAPRIGAVEREGRPVDGHALRRTSGWTFRTAAVYRVTRAAEALMPRSLEPRRWREVREGAGDEVPEPTPQEERVPRQQPPLPSRDDNAADWRHGEGAQGVPGNGGPEGDRRPRAQVGDAAGGAGDVLREGQAHGQHRHDPGVL